MIIFATFAVLDYVIKQCFENLTNIVIVFFSQHTKHFKHFKRKFSNIKCHIPFSIFLCFKSGNEIESGFFDMIGVGVAIFIFL